MADALLIVGAGGHGKVVADTALEVGHWLRIGFVDDRLWSLQEVAGLPVVGRSVDLPGLVRDWPAAIVGIGDAATRLAVMGQLAALGFSIPTLIHPSAVVSRRASIGTGTVVFAQAAVNSGASIGEACIVNTGATVDHDCRLAEGVHVCPGVSLAGGVTVGARAWIGIGSTVRNGITIGSDAMVGAGSVVVTPVPVSTTVFGVPARARKTRVLSAD